MDSFKNFVIKESRAQYYHLSASDVSKSGLSRSYAGSAAAGQEKSRFVFKGGKLDPESAMIHFYPMGRKAEHLVLQKANYYNEVDLSRYKILDLDSSKGDAIIEKANKLDGEFVKNLVFVVRESYDGMMSRGLIQLFADVPAKYITNTIPLTPDLRKSLSRTGRVE